MLEIIVNEQIYKTVVKSWIPATKKYLWIATADLKDMHMEKNGKFVPFISIMSDLVEKGIEIRLLHGKEPGENFRKDFDRFPSLIKSERFERALCPRVHFKAVIIDGKRMYMGSANLTGAGMGPRGKEKRNFETGLITDESRQISKISDYFDSIFLGTECEKCQLRKICPDPIDA